MKKIVTIIITCVVVISVTLPLLASDISDARWYGEIRVVNTGTTTTNVCVPFDLDTALLISSGYIDADCENTSIQISGADTAYMPAPGDTTDWMLFKASAPNGNSSATLYAGGADMNSKIRYFPGAGGMTKTDDNVDFELGSIFDIEQAGFIDTSAGADKNLIYKQDAIRTYISGASTITAIMTCTPETENLAPDGVGSETNITNLAGAATHWQANLTNDGDTSYVESTNTAPLYERDLYTTTDATGVGTITNVAVKIVAKWVDLGGGVLANAKTALRTNGTTYEGVANGLTNGVYNTYTTNYATNPQSGNPWSWAEVQAMEIGVSLLANGANDLARCTQVYAVVSYTPIYTVDITPVSSDEYIVNTYCDGTWFMLSLDGDTSWDGVNSDRVASNSDPVDDNGNNWAFLENYCMPYMEYQTVEIGGNPRQEIEWEYETAAPYEFADLSGQGNPVVPTFRDTSSDVDVSASIISFSPTPLGLSTSSLTGGGELSPVDILETTTGTDQTAIPDPTGLTTNPGYDIIHTIAVALNASGYNINATERMLWYSAGGIFVLVVVVGLLYLVPGHVFISGVGGVAVTGLQVAVGIFSWWTIGIAVFYLAGCIVAERTNIFG